MANPPGWYLTNPDLDIVYYWDGTSFPGATAPRNNQAFPLFSNPGQPPQQSFYQQGSSTIPNPHQQPYLVAGHTQLAVVRKNTAGKVVLFLALGLVMLFVMVGCISSLGNNSSDTPAYTGGGIDSGESSAAPDQQLTPEQKDAVYLAFLREKYPNELASISDAQIIELGKAVCSAFDSGASAEEIAVTILDNDFPAELGGAVMGAGIVTYCPQYKGEMDALVEDYS